MLESLLPEITLLIADYLPHPAVAVASLVCRSWRSRTIAILFRSVSLTSDSHITRFSHTIGNRADSPFSISQHIRSLAISSLRYDSITESGLASLVSCTSHLVQLRELRWELSFVPNNVKVLELFQAQCHQLELVALLVPKKLESGGTLGEYLCPMLKSPKFDNLVEFQLRMQYTPLYFDTDTSDPLNKMLANCPKLQSLRIHIVDCTGHITLFHINHLIASFDAELTLPFLRKLHILGDIGMTRESLMPSETGSPNFRGFLARYTHIEELCLDCVFLYDPPSDNPEHLAGALPSLKRFCGPDFICNILVRSSLAKQLECLSIQPVEVGPGKAFTPGGEYAILPLPKLKELDVRNLDCEDVFIILPMLLPVAPELETLAIESMYADEYATFLELFQYTPKLRQMSAFNLALKFDRSDPLHVTSRWVTKRGIEPLFEQMKEMCPQLVFTKPWVGSMMLDRENAKMMH
ncbi:unnamed protein product [Rhizoctonia solani]|uniref:F-box domain-containing protein n=1 Tax=Rhizoctonia solani TaxID=456999 RepID=A0A8H2XAR3_9AGAM|nr:unnamed protein product [Rhizoctonia solani]